MLLKEKTEKDIRVIIRGMKQRKEWRNILLRIYENRMLVEEELRHSRENSKGNNRCK